MARDEEPHICTRTRLLLSCYQELDCSRGKSTSNWKNVDSEPRAGEASPFGRRCVCELTVAWRWMAKTARRWSPLMGVRVVGERRRRRCRFRTADGTVRALGLQGVGDWGKSGDKAASKKESTKTQAREQKQGAECCRKCNGSSGTCQIKG